MIEAGNHRARAVEAQLGETKAGKEQVAVRFELLDLGGQSITWYGYFTDKTTESTFKALRTAGWKGMDLSDLSDLSSQETPEVTLVVEHEQEQDEYGNATGKVRARVRWVNGQGGLSLKSALAPDKAKSFAARMKGKLAAFDRTNGAPKPAPTHANGSRPPAPDAPPAGFQENDDIPF